MISTTLEAAEFVKYVDNTWHALKVSFGNEIGRLCKAVGVDSHEVMDIFLKDTKLNISPYYLKPGFAFGGSCLPKDTRGISYLAQQMGVSMPIISHINDSNEQHLQHTRELIDASGARKVALVGITFKSDTDDLRESPALILLKRLLSDGFEVSFFDPCVDSDSRLDIDELRNIELLTCQCHSLEQLMADTDIVLLSHNKDYAREVITLADTDTQVLDLVRVNLAGQDSVPRRENYQGICW
jgi:GDP-mannose 6-dehydrogenase